MNSNEIDSLLTVDPKVFVVGQFIGKEAITDLFKILAQGNTQILRDCLVI